RVRIQQTRDVTASQGAVSGAWLGTLAGLFVAQPILGAALGAAAGGLFGKLRDHGIDDGEMKQLGEELQDGEAALFLLIESRRAARTAPDGSMVLLAEQDRALWDRDLIVEGQGLVRRCLRRNDPGPYQIQAAINAVHSDAIRAEDTDWTQILRLYDQLLIFVPTPIVALNRAVALAEVEGVDAALAVVDELDLGGFHLFHATRADLLRRAGRRGEAAAAYQAALALAGNAAERSLLERRLAMMGP
ncbi:MAG: DUF1269 domain-containing protein, partial [Actinobacteria bacterium]|nr:DUF1269 domain-containing protein [Actinomycetota bacterium]